MGPLHRRRQCRNRRGLQSRPPCETRLHPSALRTRQQLPQQHLGLQPQQPDRPQPHRRPPQFLPPPQHHLLGQRFATVQQGHRRPECRCPSQSLLEHEGSDDVQRQDVAGMAGHRPRRRRRRGGSAVRRCRAWRFPFQARLALQEDRFHSVRLHGSRRFARQRRRMGRLGGRRHRRSVRIHAATARPQHRHRRRFREAARRRPAGVGHCLIGEQRRQHRRDG